MYLWREAEAIVERYWDKREIILIKGPRQAGKTTLIKHFLETKGGSYYTLDNPKTLHMFEHTPETLIDNDVIAIDEIQNSPVAGRIMRFLYDNFPDVKFIISGSGAFEKKLGVSAYLVGRFKEVVLLPLSFREFVRWRDERLWRSYEMARKNFWNFLEKGYLEREIILPDGIGEYFEEYLRLGGYPQVVLERSKEKLTEIVKSTVERDIVYFFGLREKRNLLKLMKALAYMSGKMLSISSLPVDYKTAHHYLSILEENYIIKEVRPYFTNPLKELRKASKIYFYDLGFRQVFFNEQGFDVEHAVFRAFLPDYYWRTKSKAEVDFVIKHEEGIIPIEVKSLGEKSRGLQAFVSIYKPKCAVMLWLKNEVAVSEIKGVPLLKYPIYYV